MEHKEPDITSPNLAINAEQKYPDDCPLGSIIGEHYIVETLIGSGGMGNVYKGVHIYLKKPVAIKLLKFDIGISRESLLRFEHEAKAASELKHPRLVLVSDFGVTDKGLPYIIMDFAEGETLEKIIQKEGRLKEREALELFAALADGLKFAHEKGVLHRDLKPGNIVIRRDQQGIHPTIIDFGIAKSLNQKDENQTKLTKTGEIFGSPLYMSPEQCNGFQVDQRSDVYSLGCVMYECLTGQPPFKRDSPIQVFIGHLNEAVPPFKKVAGSAKVSGDLEHIVMKALEKKPEDRYQDVQQLLSDLSSLLDGKTPTRRRLSRRKVSTKMVFGIAASMLAMIGIAFLVLQFGSISSGGSNGNPGSIRTAAAPPAWQQLQNNAFTQWGLGPDHYARAEVLLKETMQKMESDQAPLDRKIFLVQQMGKFYHSWGRVTDSRNSYERALLLASKGAKNSNVEAEVRNDLMKNLTESGSYVEAIEQGDKALEIYRLTQPESEVIVETLYNLGTAYNMNKSPQQAMENYREAFMIAGKLHPDGSSRLQAISAQVLAYELAELGRIEEALEYGRKALELHKKIQGVSANETRVAATWLAAYAQEHGHSDEASRIKTEFNL